ncbi:Bifunctional adenosine 5'-phosphosulfate phosphorylase/adenylylsulfatase hint4 [Lathyrus oleraceus]|uniref:Bifunctional adenosine 5'-phosphosulfate phosphorylase/adenylylsulfatase hint4 n=1 Tax=Pisum sativum TaxID=3888 RepID=A0A9D5BAD5_PEA|nr:Bifunctional adenosine 5'-phosphosulfate phosphorylase/adenylylsulfatase hint4 [Pisum sativum]
MQESVMQAMRSMMMTYKTQFGHGDSSDSDSILFMTITKVEEDKTNRWYLDRRWNTHMTENKDDKVVAFRDINPSAFRHYLVIPVKHIPTVNDLQRNTEDYSLVSHMLDVGKMLLLRDAPHSKQYRFGFHQPPLNSVNHLHLHCLALPYTPRWRCMKYLPFGPIGFIEAEKFLEKIKPVPGVHSKV